MEARGQAGHRMSSGVGRFLLRGAQLLLGGLFLASSVYVFYLAAIGRESLTLVAAALAATVIPFALGTLIERRYPGHMVGRLFHLMAYSTALWVGGAAANQLNQSGVVVFTPWVSDLTLLLAETMYFPVIFIPFVLMPLYFPNGKLLSPRWRPLVALILFAIGWGIVGTALRPWPTPDINISRAGSWNGIPGSEPFFTALDTLLLVLVLPVIPLVVLSIFLRYRRSDPVERTQMKWPIFAVVCCVVLFALGAVPTFQRWNVESDYFLSLAPAVLFPLSIGIAILRYRLFDIDVIIRRTVQYAIVTALLALVYFGLVVTFQTFVSDFRDEQSGIFIVISTLVIAALFNPLRLRVQAAVDRRFYRRKYQAEQALAQFATAARDEVELDRLTAALMAVVEETLQPEQASLLLVRQGDNDSLVLGARLEHPGDAD